MDSLSYKTQYLSHNDIHESWFVVDAKNVPLGRLSSVIALHLRGKHRPDYTPNMNMRTKVVVINAELVRLSGRKWDQKTFIYHTGYPGGQKAPTYRMLRDKNPSKVIEIAVKGMLPKNRLGRDLFRNLYVYAGETHPHGNHAPQPLEFHLN
jgi:large subunit ribosomal protein L13